MVRNLLNPAADGAESVFAHRGTPVNRRSVNGPIPTRPELSPYVALHLLDSSTGRQVRTWQFDGKPLITIGRAPEQHVQIDDPYVSRSHAELRFDRGQWSLVSLGRYGVQVEGQAITEIPVQGQLTFRLGASGPTLRFNPRRRARITA